MRRGIEWATAATAVMILLASAAAAFIPPAPRALKEIAKVNRASNRTKLIQLELTMRAGESETAFPAEMLSHPSGLARMEIRGEGGHVDRYLLSGTEFAATRDGRQLENPKAILPPLFPLQAFSETTLEAALETLGVEVRWIGLAPCGEQDCFVIGDPRLAAPLPPAIVESVIEESDALTDPLADLFPKNKDRFVDALRDPSTGELVEVSDAPGIAALRDEDIRIAAAGHELTDVLDELADSILALPESGMIPRLWVDTQELQIRRIDQANGVFVIFGPVIRFGRLELPAWFEIHEPNAPTLRFEVGRATAVQRSLQAFGWDWLMMSSDRPRLRLPFGR
ncbi:MAG: hypothetical protein VCB25_12525 [Myxococcota bacterium]